MVAMVIPIPLLEPEEMVSVTISSLLLEKSERVIMTIPIPLLEKSEMMYMTISSLLLEKNDRVIMAMPSPFWKRQCWWPWSDHSLVQKGGDGDHDHTKPSFRKE